MCLDPSSQTLLVDHSDRLIKQLLFDPLPPPALPVNASEMFDWLFGFDKLRIPVTPLLYQHASTYGRQRQFLVPQDEAASAVVTFTELLQTAPDLPFGTELHTSVYVCDFVGRVWRTLKTFSPEPFMYGLLFNKTSQLNTDSSHVIAPKSPPNTMLAAECCALLLGEDKHSDLGAAYDALSRKRVDLTGMHYGTVKFLLGYAAAGTTLRWCFLPGNTNQVRPLQIGVVWCMILLAYVASYDFVLYF